MANGRGARRSLRGAPHALAVALALGLASACTLTNDLDVCAGAPAAVGVNQHIDGNQSLESPATMAVMPSGEALVLFGSTVAGRDAENALEMRAVRVTSAGAPVAGCTTRDEREQSFFPVAVGDPTAQVTRAVQVLPAPGAMVIQFTGLTLVTRKVGTAKAEVIATSVGPQGCFGATSEPFTVTELAANRGLAPDVFPKAVPLAVEGGTQPYAIFWVENDLSLRRVGRARMIRTRGGLVETVETLASPTGAPVDLDLGGGALVTALDVTATGPDELTVLYTVTSVGSVSKLLLARFDTQLQPLSGASLLKNDFSLGSTLGGAKVLAAFDGTHVLALWTEGKSGGTTRLVAQSFLPDGRSVGPARTVGDAALAANDSRPALMAMKGGGFLVAWRQQVSSGAGDTGAVSLRVAALDSFGRGAFNNVACGESDFQLATAGGGDLGQPALSVAPDGRVLVAYTNRRAESSLSLNDISLVSLEPSRLFPSGVLRPPAPAPRTIGAPPQTIGGPHPSCQGTLAGKAGRACTCDEKCEDPGAICRAEELSGRAGGFCHLECNPNLSGSCPAGSMCKAQSSIALGGLCQRACTRDADCGVGRVCLPETGSCMYVCASPSDCRSGTCDPYSGACAGLNANPDAGGLLAPCVDDLDCRSLSCTPADHALYPKRCETLCRADRPACPENGVCVPLSGNLGICLPPCSSKQTCKAGSGLLCFELSSIDVPVCLPP